MCLHLQATSGGGGAASVTVPIPMDRPRRKRGSVDDACFMVRGVCLISLTNSIKNNKQERVGASAVPQSSVHTEQAHLWIPTK